MDSGRQKDLLNKRLVKYEAIIGETELLIDQLETRIMIRGPYDNLKVLKKTLEYERKKLEETIETYWKERRNPTIC